MEQSFFGSLCADRDDIRLVARLMSADTWENPKKGKAPKVIGQRRHPNRLSRTIKAKRRGATPTAVSKTPDSPTMEVSRAMQRTYPRKQRCRKLRSKPAAMNRQR